MIESSRHSNCIMGYYVTHEAYYASSRPADEKEIMIGLYSKEGGTTGEFAMRWIDLGGTTAARMELFEDSWSALQEIQERTARSFLRKLAEMDGTNPSPKDIIDLLNQLGFKDRTTRESPYQTTDAICQARQSALEKLTDAELSVLGLRRD